MVVLVVGVAGVAGDRRANYFITLQPGKHVLASHLQASLIYVRYCFCMLFTIMIKVTKYYNQTQAWSEKSDIYRGCVLTVLRGLLL